MTFTILLLWPIGRGVVLHWWVLVTLVYSLAITVLTLGCPSGFPLGYLAGGRPWCFQALCFNPSSTPEVFARVMLLYPLPPPVGHPICIVWTHGLRFRCLSWNLVTQVTSPPSMLFLGSCNLLCESCLLRSLCSRGYDRVTAFPGFTDSLVDQSILLLCWCISIL